VAVVALSVALRVSGVTEFHAYPMLSWSITGVGGVLCLCLLACAVLPFADRRGIGP
jgi:hypothetical protein